MVFGNRVKHSFECLTDIDSQTINILGEIQNKSFPNLMIIKITFPNLLHRSDFLCYLVMNYLLKSLRSVISNDHYMYLLVLVLYCITLYFEKMRLESIPLGNQTSRRTFIFMFGTHS